MSDLKLFRVSTDGVVEVEGTSVTLEKSLQSLIEQHLDAFLGVRFLATEYGTGAKHGGRIDTLGLDENGCPVIVEYKRALNENVINQGCTTWTGTWNGRPPGSSAEGGFDRNAGKRAETKFCCHHLSSKSVAAGAAKRWPNPFVRRSPPWPECRRSSGRGEG